MPPQQFLENYAYLNSEDIADGVVYVLGTPPHVQVCQSLACKLGEVVMIFDITYRPGLSLSNRGGAADHSFCLTLTTLLYMYQITRPRISDDVYRKM